jgi:hypothetical protein
MSNERTEHSILLCVTRRELSASHKSQLEQCLRSDVDWNYLCNTAIAHGVLPLLTKHLSEGHRSIIPGEVMARFSAHALRNARDAQMLTERLLHISEVFAQNQIVTAAFKGPVLAEVAYGDITLRQCGDIDLLIDGRQFTEAKALLESVGYQMMPALTKSQEHSHRSFHCEVEFVRQDSSPVLDLHWALTPKSFVFNLTSMDIMSRLQRVRLMNNDVLTFGLEDLVIYLSMHGSKHLWWRLEWIGSLAEVIRSSSLDWGVVVARASASNCKRILALGLRLAQLISGEVVPEHVFASIDGDGRMARIAKHFYANLFLREPCEPESSETNLYNLQVMDRKRDALTSIARALIVPTLSDWEALTLPPSLHSLYYAYRPLRLSRVYASRFWRRLFSAL